MGQIKNIKLHIVTDIKGLNKSPIRSPSSWFTVKCGFLTLVRMEKVRVNVVCVPTNMVSFESTDSACVDNASKNMLTISDSKSSSRWRRWTMMMMIDADVGCMMIYAD